MSVRGPMFEIWCDRCGSVGGVASFASKNRTSAWRAAVGRGWKRIARQDVCPTCIDRDGVCPLDCKMCSGETCAKCGAGKSSNPLPDGAECTHDVIERHETRQ